MASILRPRNPIEIHTQSSHLLADSFMARRLALLAAGCCSVALVPAPVHAPRRLRVARGAEADEAARRDVVADWAQNLFQATGYGVVGAPKIWWRHGASSRRSLLHGCEAGGDQSATAAETARRERTGDRNIMK